MSGETLALDVWLDPTHARPTRAYLDPVDWEAFASWIDRDRASRLPPLLEGTWHVRLFNSLTKRHLGSDRRRNATLKALGIEILNEPVTSTNELFVAEVLRSYFHQDPAARVQAELLAQARRIEGNGRVAVIRHYRY